MNISRIHQLINITIILSVLFMTLPSFAASFIRSQKSAVEATGITVHMARGAQTGTVRITGCEGCPMELNITSQTQFLYKHKQADPRRIRLLSGKPGTVIFDSETQQAIRINW